MAKVKLRPAEYVIHVFGGIAKTARATQYGADAVLKWKYRSGTVPTNAQRPILRAARSMGLDITANDLMEGREVDVD